ncbi:MAG: PEMT/PEM2 methyltransferase family protein [Pseudomonadota bacterium]
MLLFRGYLYPLIAFTALKIELIEGARALWQYGVGGTLFLIGFGLAFRITFSMGWRNAFGEKRGLQTTGWFAWSRNPIYVVTWIGLMGWALIAKSLLVTLLLFAWALLYLLAPLVEEPWLEKHYGEEYLAYKETTPRFL